jgi:hypothetical protein
MGTARGERDDILYLEPGPQNVLGRAGLGSDQWAPDWSNSGLVVADAGTISVFSH